MEVIHASDLPEPKGHYSHAVESNGLLFVSGVLPDEAPAGTTDNFERQVRSVFERCQKVLNAGNSSIAQVVQCTAYLSDVENWPEFNRIYASIFTEHKPARAVVPVSALHYGFMIEVQLVAEVTKP